MTQWFFSFLIGFLCITPIAAARSSTIVLVHGALLTGDVWQPVKMRLESQGHTVIAPHVVGRGGDGLDPRTLTLQFAAQKICESIQTQQEPVILVGHSQGGAVITQAISYCADRIKALVYVSAVVPLNGESVFQELDVADNANFERCATYDVAAKLYRINRAGPISAMFMADVPRDAAILAIATMVPEPSEIGNGILNYPVSAFDQIPKFYIETTQDLIISLNTQKRIQSKIHWNRIFTLNSSHSPFLSQPNQLSHAFLEIEAELCASILQTPTLVTK